MYFKLPQNRYPLPVIPAKAEIHCITNLLKSQTRPDALFTGIIISYNS